MTYNKTTWIDDVTLLNAENLNNIEDGIENAYKELNNKADKSQIGNIETALDAIITLQEKYMGGKNV